MNYTLNPLILGVNMAPTAAKSRCRGDLHMKEERRAIQPQCRFVRIRSGSFMSSIVLEMRLCEAI
jgi:hypothetical protein